MVAYSISILGCFGVIIILSGKDRDTDVMDDFQGLFFHAPWLTGIFTVMLLSLAGIPMTAGFLGKFYIVKMHQHVPNNPDERQIHPAPE